MDAHNVLSGEKNYDSIHYNSLNTFKRVKTLYTHIGI